MPPLTIVLINQLIQFFITYFSRLEKYPTITEFNTSIAWKMTAALFINTGVVALFVYRGNMYGNYGLVSEMYAIILANAMLSPLMPLVSPKI
jgi:hypothetical protein